MDIILITNNKPSSMISKIKELDNTVSDEHSLIFTGLDASASVNRNIGLSKVTSDIFIMLDDDVEGFYNGWVEDLVKPMLKEEDILVISARLINQDGSVGAMMGDNKVSKAGTWLARPNSYKGYVRLPTACLAVRKNDVRFDEGFIGSGYEDTDYFNKLNECFPRKKIMINNDCRLIHYNVQKNQGGEYFEHNKKYYLSLYPDDTSAKNQKDWTKR